MQIKILVAALAVCVMLMSGCLPSAEQNYLGFRQSDISATVCGSLQLTKSDGYSEGGACSGIGSDGRCFEFKAQICTRAGDGARTSTVKFISPEHLDGFEIRYSESGAVFVLNGDKNISSGELKLDIPNICDAFYIGSTVVSVNPQADGKIEVYLSNGTKNPIAIYVFENGNPIPCEIRATTEKFKIELFDINIQSGG